MQITTLEQLAESKVGDTLFLINPFGMGNQALVPLEEFTISEVNQKSFAGGSVMKSLDIDGPREHYFSDMILSPNYIFTSWSEAKEKLVEVHGGIHSVEVKSHHDSCREAFKYSYMY